MKIYYTLSLRNEWQYLQNDGSTYINKVIAANKSEFTMHNSAANTTSVVVKMDDNQMSTDGLEKGNFQIWLPYKLEVGKKWVIAFKANGLDCLLLMTVKEIDITKEVSGHVYHDVVCIEAESQIIMNGSTMQLNFFTQYYYAAGVGLVLTTSSAGDIHELTSYQLH